MLAPVNDWVAPVMTPFVGLKEPKESKESKEKELVKEKEAGLLSKNHCMEELGKFRKKLNALANVRIVASWRKVMGYTLRSK